MDHEEVLAPLALMPTSKFLLVSGLLHKRIVRSIVSAFFRNLKKVVVLRLNFASNKKSQTSMHQADACTIGYSDSLHGCFMHVSSLSLYLPFF